MTDRSRGAGADPNEVVASRELIEDAWPPTLEGIRVCDGWSELRALCSSRDLVNAD